MNSKRGSLFIILLVGIIGIGILATRLIPDETINVVRQKEKELSQELTDLRMSVLLDRQANDSVLYDGDWDKIAEFEAYLNDLVAKNYLSEIPKDPNIPDYRWGIGAGKIYWQPTRNFAASSSFETDDLGKTTWTVGSSNIEARITDKLWPGSDGQELDLFPGQNRFGTNLWYSGSSLVLEQK